MKLNTDFVHPGDAPELQQAAKQSFLKNLPLVVRTYENATIDPIAGVWVNNTPVFDSQPPSPQIIVDEEVVFIDSFGACWGHCITDHLRRLWFCFSSQYGCLENLKFVFIDSLWPHSVLQLDNFWAMLRAIGIPCEKFNLIEKPTRFLRVFVPDPCFYYDVHSKYLHYTPEFVDFFNRLPQLAPPPNLNIEKIYFSRVAFQLHKKDFNEKDVENLFKQQGFTIIYPEQLDFLTALAILQNCKIFAATDGSIAHNLLFCKNGTQAIILRKTRHFTLHQMLINCLKNADVVYIDACFSPFAEWRKKDWQAGPFFLFETKYLSRFFNLPRKHFPILKFFKYIHKCLPTYLNNEVFVFTHPLRARLKIRTRLRNLIQKISNKNPR